MRISAVIGLAWFFLIGSLYAQQEQYGSLTELISQIRQAMPGSESNAFVVPTPAQQDSFGTVMDLILQQEYSQADSLAKELDYALYRWYDTDQDQALFYVLMEPNANQTWGVHLGWGTYIFNPGGLEEVVIEVPHPYHDTNTWEVGFAAYQYLGSKFFLMAGTHRYANGSNPAPADVAHNTQNIFYTVHQRVSPHSTHSLQIHGFSRSKPKYENYPDVVLSNGTPYPGPILDSLEMALTSIGYSVGIFDGVHYSLLGAVTNTEGQWCNSLGYSFIHMELEYFIRTSRSEWENVLDVLYQIFSLPVGIELPGQKSIPQNIELFPNYPNPFNPQTFIRFKLNKPQRVNLDIFDVHGRMIRRLIEAVKTAGDHQTVWQGDDDRGQLVSSGIYFLRLKVGENQITRKMILLR